MAQPEVQRDPALTGSPAGGASEPGAPPRIEPIATVGDIAQPDPAPDAQAPADEILELDSPGEPPPPPPQPIETRSYDPAPDRENVRGKIAKWLILLLAGIVAGSFVFLWFRPTQIDQLKELLALILGPVVALVGAATGYYFGAAAESKK
jgi:hypothetical protein